MKVEINNNRKIFAIQEEFNTLFPDLKIEFHEKPSSPGGPSSKKLVKSSNKTLAEYRAVHNSGSITILPGMTLGELKQNFGDVYGLTIDIFKKPVNNKGDRLLVSEKTILEELNKDVAHSKSLEENKV